MTDAAQHADQPTRHEDETWLMPGVRGIGSASFLADVGHGIPTVLVSSTGI
ncbi:hypothetical protein [Streptomyces sp. NPDC048637]|uniref:hypothetical protein n=1 Tax=Streptomyces sp. NPDC048637 TaxID=3155636 RepID=UPI0034123092